MKTLGFIIAVVALLLTVVPCCSFEDCKTEIVIENHDPFEHPRDLCEGYSPFLTCGSCTSFVIEKSDLVLFSKPLHREKTDIPYYSTNTGEFIQPVWQPPQIS